MLWPRRSAIIAAALGLTIMSSPAAHAGPSAAAFEGTMHINCWGCGTSTGTFLGTGAGVVDGQQFAGTVTSSFTVFAPDGGFDSCLLDEAPIEGRVDFPTVGPVGVSGSYSGSLVVTAGAEERVPNGSVFAPGTAVAEVSVVFDSGATARMEFGGPLVSPLGAPCGNYVDAVVQGGVFSPATNVGCVVGTCTGQRNAVAFEGTWNSVCFGCGVSTGTANLSVTTAGLGGVGIGMPATASFDTAEGTGITCLISGSAAGTMAGAINVAFQWTRLGAFAVMTTTGDINGAGFGTFVVTSPVGVPCGVPAEAHWTGVIAGT